MALSAKAINLGSDDYRKGALERLADAWVLLRAEQFAGSVSDAGRAVEGMLRAVIWKRDADVRAGQKSLDTGHDLRDLLIHVRNLGLLSPAKPEDDILDEKVQKIGRLWFNNMRFVSSKYLETRWHRLGEVHKTRTLKQAADSFYFACAQVLKRCEVLCQR